MSMSMLIQLLVLVYVGDGLQVGSWNYMRTVVGRLID